MMIPYDLYPILARYAALISDYLERHFTPTQIEEYREVLRHPETTYRAARQLIVVDCGHPEKAFYALDALERIKHLADFAEKPSEITMGADEAFVVAFSALRAGMMVGALVGDEAKPEMEELNMEAIRAEERSRVAQKAAVKKNIPLTQFKEDAAAVIREQWAKGSTLLHHQMAEFLGAEYQDQCGKFPFMYLPLKRKDKLVPAENVLRNVAKAVAKQMNRTDLIFGNPGKK